MASTSNNKKLASRKRPAKETMNSSEEDFKEFRPLNLQKKAKITEIKTQECDINESVQGSQHLIPPCPLCGKAFTASETKSQRIRHLKSCGAEKGMTPDQLIKIVQLEERQAEERKALGLPAVSAFAPPVQKQNKSLSQSARGKSSRSSQKTVDPHLEMALALSASLAHSNAIKEEEETETLKALNIKIEEDKRPKTEVPEVLLPNATAVSAKVARAGHYGKAKTALEVRLEDERQRIIGDRVAIVLASSVLAAELGPITTQLDRGKCSQLGLSGKFSRNKRCWELASACQGNYYCEKIMQRFAKESNKALSVQATENTAGESPNNMVKKQSSFAEKLFSDWSNLWNSKAKSDMIIYSKENESIDCHSLVIFVRCAKILDEVITENDFGEERKILAWSDFSSGSIHLFLRYIYTAEIGEIRKHSEYKDLRQISKKYGVREIMLALETIDKELLVPEDEEEEFDELCKSEAGDQMNHSTDFSGAEEALVTYQSDSPTNSVAPDEQSIAKRREVTKKESPSKTSEQRKEVFDSDNDLFEDSFNKLEDNEENGVKERSKNESRFHGVADVEIWENFDYEVPGSQMNEFEDERIGDSEKENLEQNSQVSQKQLEPSAKHKEAEENLWENFDCDIVHYDWLASSHPTKKTDGDEIMKVKSQETPVKCETPLPPRRSYTQHDKPGSSGRSMNAPHYENMLSPELRQELKRFGLRAIPRKKAVPLLQHIFKETQKITVKDEEKENHSGPENSSSQESNSNNDDKEEDYEDEKEVLEESLFFAKGNDDESERASSSPQKKKLIPLHGQELTECLKKFILSDKDLHRQVLLYEPVWLEDLAARLKESQGVKCKLSDLIDCLDCESITFRTRASSSRQSRARKVAKKSSKT